MAERVKDEVQVTVIAYEAEPAELPEPDVIEAPEPQAYARSNDLSDVALAKSDDMTGRNGGMGGWFGTKRWSSRGGSALVNGAPTRYSVSEYSTNGNDKRRYRRMGDDWMQD
jgi:hypothetical protein